MRTFNVEVFADGRPVRLPAPVVAASTPAAAIGKAARYAKPFITRRGTKQLTVRITAIKSVSAPDHAGQ